jgi:uncharacterized linocin/CFP29 family protein
MSHHVPGLSWTDEQWAEANQVVQEAARKARVASSFLPLVGPLPPGQASVPKLEMTVGAPPQNWYGTGVNRFRIDDGITLKLTTIACEVYLSTQQVEDPELASAKQMLRRAAVLLGRLEDAIVFNGQANEDLGPPTPPAVPPLPAIYTITGGQTNPGLVNPIGLAAPAPVPVAGGNWPQYSESIVAGVVTAIGQLERDGHYGPFACVLGDDLFLAANTPSPNSMVLPSDRILPFLEGGPLLRSGTIQRNLGGIVALGGSPVDLVVGSDVHVRFVQVTLEPRYVMRVCERFVLRVKYPNGVRRLRGPAAPPPPAAVPAKAAPAKKAAAKAAPAKKAGAKKAGG